jgi:hypothetical protein
MTDLAPLLARLEAADAGSRELDAAIAVAIGYGLPAVRPADDLIYLKLPRKDDGCAAGTFWRKSRSGASLHTALCCTMSVDDVKAAITDHMRRVGRHGYEIYVREVDGEWALTDITIPSYEFQGRARGVDAVALALSQSLLRLAEHDAALRAKEAQAAEKG